MVLSLMRSLFSSLNAKDEILIDTDVGDDIDDAFAVAWALASSRVKVRAILTAHGDTEMRARLVRRMLYNRKCNDVSILTGIRNETDIVFTQKSWAEGGPPVRFEDGIAAALDLIKRRKHKITLVALAPLHNIEAMIRRDPATFRLLKRVVLMGGSIRRGYNSLDGEINFTPQGEHNIFLNPLAFQALLNSGVAITMMPLDAVQARPSAQFLELVASRHPDLAELLALWQKNNIFNISQPTLFDLVAIAAVLSPELCRLTPMCISVEKSGMTLETNDGVKVQACLSTNHESILSAAACDLCDAKISDARMSLTEY